MSPLLEVVDLRVRHGLLTAVQDVSLSVAEREVLALLGANGAGKSTLLRTIAGLHPPAAGRVLLDGVDVTRMPAERRVAAGIVLVPEGRRLFPSLTVEENLLVGSYHGRSGSWTLPRVYELFSWMAARRRQPAGVLSGGQQQAVAIARALLANPRLLLLDEPSLGLAPVVVQLIYGTLPALVESGVSVLLVEQDVRQALRVADRVGCLLEGRQTLEGRPGELTIEQVEQAYFGLSGRGRADGAPTTASAQPGGEERT